jgi:hypothetical protein
MMSSTVWTPQAATARYLVATSTSTLLYCASQDASVHRIANVSALASAVTSSVFSLAKSFLDAVPLRPLASSVNPSTGIAPATLMPTWLSLADPRRIITGMWPSPCGRYVALADSLGRVMVFDTLHAHFVRMWKGVRDAQCAWMTHRNRRYLCIWSRRKAVIEVYPMRRGNRIAVLKADDVIGLVDSRHGEDVKVFILNRGGWLTELALPPHLLFGYDMLSYH